jgi:methionine-rich copper-binding protein CopC
MVSKLLLTLSGSLALPAAFLFHTELKKSFPERDAMLKAPPEEVVLTYSGRVNAKLSAISILRPDSTEVMKLVVEKTPDAKVLRATMTRPLPPGRYVVRWKTGAADGHVVRGAYGFSIDVVE